MNEKHIKFLSLTKELEALQVKVQEIRELLEKEMRSLDYNYMCQDPETGAVYKIVEPKGKFVYYANVDYVRTALAGEERGTLSKKEATEAGFKLVKS